MEQDYNTRTHLALPAQPMLQVVWSLAGAAPSISVLPQSAMTNLLVSATHTNTRRAEREGRTAFICPVRDKGKDGQLRVTQSEGRRRWAWPNTHRQTPFRQL